MSAHSLRMLKTGQQAVVVDIEADEAERMRLESMGILPGVELGVLADANGRMLVSVGAGRIVLEADVARKLIVV